MRNELKPELIEQSYSIGNEVYRLLRVRNLDALVDQIDDEHFNKDERLPYWAELWPSAIGLARYIKGNPQIVRGKTVLELGCGLGLTSMVISGCKPKQILVTDYEQDALDVAEKNFALNGKTPPQFKMLDWREANLDQKFEVIIAADILYEERFFTPLIRLLNSYLAHSGKIIIGEPNRPVAQNFYSGLLDHGFAWLKQMEPVEQDGQIIRINIFQIHKKVWGLR